MAGDASLRLAFSHHPSQHHSSRIFCQASIGIVFCPEPVFGIGIVSGTLEHYRNRFQVFFRIVGNRINANSRAPIVTFDNNAVQLATDINRAIKGIENCSVWMLQMMRITKPRSLLGAGW